MDFGVALGSNLRIDQIAEHSRVAEENGFSHLGFVDQPLQDRDVVVSMTIAALNTRQILIGQSVTDPFTYHPLVIANAIASINELSNGRAFVGIGAGGSGAKGGIFKPVLLQELREAVEFIQRFTSGEEAEFKGVWASRGVVSKIHSVWSKKRIPVYWGGNGLRSMELAGEVADGVIISGGVHPEMIKMKMEKIEKGALKAGRDPSEIDIWLNPEIYVAESKEAARYESASFAATKANGTYRWSLRNPELGQLLERVDPGITDELKQIHKAYDSYQHERPGAPHSDLVTQRVIDFFLLVGNSEDICEKIFELQKLGRDSGLRVRCIEAAVYTIIDQKGMMKEIGDKIIPHFRS